MTAKKNEVKLDVEARVRQGVKAVLEEVLEEEMTQHLKAGYREFTPPGVVSAMATTHGVFFLNETSAATLATEIALRSSEQWALKRYLTIDALEAVQKPNPQHSRH